MSIAMGRTGSAGWQSLMGCWPTKATRCTWATGSHRRAKPHCICWFKESRGQTLPCLDLGNWPPCFLLVEKQVAMAWDLSREPGWHRAATWAEERCSEAFLKFSP